MNKLLIGIDDQPGAMKAVEYVARHFGGTDDLQVGLVHVLPNLPAIFWDEGHILSAEEKGERKKFVDKWLAAQKTKMEPVFGKALGILERSGVKPARVVTKSISDSTDVADSLLEETRDGEYQTIVVGRCERAAKHVLGSVAGKIVSQGRNIAVTIVE
jgi:nucleotide-binding universal stress UspA family protein